MSVIEINGETKTCHKLYLVREIAKLSGYGI